MFKREPKAHTITRARPSLSEDVAARQRKYFISMMIRTTCFVLMVVFSGPWRWVFLAGALFLPYIAVVVANAGREPLTDPIEIAGFESRAIEPPQD